MKKTITLSAFVVVLVVQRRLPLVGKLRRRGRRREGDGARRQHFVYNWGQKQLKFLLKVRRAGKNKKKKKKKKERKIFSEALNVLNPNSPYSFFFSLSLSLSTKRRTKISLKKIEEEGEER